MVLVYPRPWITPMLLEKHVNLRMADRSSAIWREEGPRMGQGCVVPILGVHSFLGMGEGSELVTQGIHPVVRHSRPADAGACARGSGPQWLHAPSRQVWSRNTRTPRERLVLTASPSVKTRLPSPCPCSCHWTEGGGSGQKGK